MRGTNSSLPQAIAVLWATEVDGEFHARYSAASRTYRYVLYNHAVRPSVLAGKVGWFHLPARRRAHADGGAGARRSARLQRVPRGRVPGADAGAGALGRRRRAARRLRAVRALGQRLPASHGAQRRRLPGVRRQGRGAARVAGGGARERGIGAAPPPTFGPDGLYLTAVTYPQRWNLPAFPPMLAFDRNGAMRTRVKICGIRRPSTARRRRVRGPTRSGCLLSAKPAAGDDRARARDRGCALPPFVTRVGLFVDASVAEVEARRSRLPPGSPAVPWRGNARVLRRIRPAVPARGAGETGGRFARIRCRLFTTPRAGSSTPTGDDLYGGTGEAFDWALIPRRLARRSCSRAGSTPGTWARRSAGCARGRSTSRAASSRPRVSRTSG